MTKLFFGTLMKMAVEALIARLIVGVIMAVGALVYLTTPGVKTAFTNFVSKRQAAPVSNAPAVLPRLSEEELSPPPMGDETAAAAPIEEPGPAVTTAVETAPDDTFEKIMAIYENDAKGQTGDNSN